MNLFNKINITRYLCRPEELNSSSPVLPEEAHSLEHSTALSCPQTQRIYAHRGMTVNHCGREREREREKEGEGEGGGVSTEFKLLS